MGRKASGAEMTAEELLEFYGEHYGQDAVFREIFGEEYDFDTLMRRFGSREIVERISVWKGDGR